MNENTFYDSVHDMICYLLSKYERETPFHDRWDMITDVDTNEILVGRGGIAQDLLSDLLDDRLHIRYHI